MPDDRMPGWPTSHGTQALDPALPRSVPAFLPHVFSPGRHVLFALLICIVPGASAWADTFQFKRYGYAWCPEQHAGQLKAIIDVDGRREIDAKLKGAVSGGACMGGGTSFQVINVRTMRTPKGRAYVCFTAVDPVDRSTSGPYCAQAEAITTIAAEVSRRTGAYRIVGEGPAGLKVECLEGGFRRRVPLGRKGECCLDAHSACLTAHAGAARAGCSAGSGGSSTERLQRRGLSRQQGTGAAIGEVTRGSPFLPVVWFRMKVARRDTQ